MSDLVLTAPEPRQLAPSDLLQLALTNNAGIDVIERLAALQREAMARDAEVDFNMAMNRIQEKIKRIAPDLENRQTSSRYASYAAIDRKIRPIYSEEGLSLSFDTADCPLQEHVRVVCYVALRGHTRRYQVDMPCDGKGAKGGDVMTKTHAAGAAMSYGMRYLVKGIFNIAVGEEDSDGNAPAPLEDNWLNEQLEEISRCETKEGADSAFKAAAAKALEHEDVKAYKALRAAAKNRKAKL